MQEERHFALHFCIQKLGHFALRDFHRIFENGGGGGGHFYLQKQCNLRYIYVSKKKSTLRYILTYTNPDTLRYLTKP